MINDTLFFMLIVGIIISAGMLFLFLCAAKTGQFNDANNKEKNLKVAKEEKIKSKKEEKTS